MSHIAVLTSGGDSPGMNAAVMSVAKNAAYYGLNLLGIKRGYNGLLGRSEKQEDDFVRLDLDTVLDIADLPGTYLRTARCLEFLDPQVREKAAQRLRDMDVTGLVVIGGNGSHYRALYTVTVPAAAKERHESAARYGAKRLEYLFKRVGLVRIVD